jgi:diaminohydroxyphosphoribosylaminopyrimidine deaminase/5-amino-6-(5-phosphoribosylamino)uracil reductase
VDVFEAEDLPEALEALHGFEVQHLFVEGGARIAQEFLRQSLVDRLIIFQSPITLGTNALSPFGGLPGNFRETLPRLRIVRRAEFGEDVMSVYAMREA